MAHCGLIIKDLSHFQAPYYDVGVVNIQHFGFSNVVLQALLTPIAPNPQMAGKHGRLAERQSANCSKPLSERKSKQAGRHVFVKG
jgi:hypothetical protein